MHRFVQNANIEHYRKLISESTLDPSRDEDRHQILLTFNVAIPRGGEGRKAPTRRWRLGDPLAAKAVKQLDRPYFQQRLIAVVM